MSGDPCGRREIGDELDGPVGKSRQDLVQVVADRDAEPAAAFDHRENRRYLRTSLLAADVDPVLAAGRDGPHGVLSQVVAEFQFRVFEEARQSLP